MISAFKKMNAESFSSAWKGNISCEECSIRLNVFRKKKVCFFCKNSFCQVCIMRREDKKFCCRKCQILTARPLDRNELLNLKSKDLVNYLTSRHISINGCVEKEDLVNVLMRAVNNSCFHPSSSQFDTSSCTNSYPNSPRNNSYSNAQSNAKRKFSHSVEDLFNEDGIRITGHNSLENDIHRDHFSHSDGRDLPYRHVNTVDQHDGFSEGQSDGLSNSNQNDDQANDTADLLASEEIWKSNYPIGDNEETQTNKPLTLSDIKSKADLESLSVKQLKELLMRNRTDFKGCIERAELIQKANRLWSDYTVSRKDLEKLSLDELCKICMDAPIECVLLECGHMATCTSCGKQLCECPICRQFVVRCVRTFKV